MAVMDVCAELAALLEPDMDRRIVMATPPRGGSEWVPGTLYVFPFGNTTYERPATGPVDEEHFTIRFAWCLDNDFERAGGDVDDAVTAALASKAAAIRAGLLAATGSTFEDVHLESVDFAALVTNSQRGIYADAVGYVLGS